MLGTILVAALLLGYGGWVIVRKVRQGRGKRAAVDAVALVTAAAKAK